MIVSPAARLTLGSAALGCTVDVVNLSTTSPGPAATASLTALLQR